MKQRYTIYALFLLSLFVSISASAQIKGVITDSLTNEPLMYITVQYEGKGVGGISNANGEYQVETRKGWDELTFSAVGYITKKVKLKPGTRVLNVKLQSDDIMLSEVVVKPKKEKYSRKNNPAVEFIPSMMVFSLLGFLRKMVLLAVSLMEMGRIILLVLGDTSTWSLKKENFL